MAGEEQPITAEEFDNDGEGEGEGGEEAEREVEVEMDENEASSIESIPKRRVPLSAPDLTGLSENEIQTLLAKFSDDEIEDLFDKNTESFRCLAQILISRSSIMRNILYHFPEPVDPGIDEAFEYVEPAPQFDTVGIEKYQSLCKDMNIVPISRVKRSLDADTLNLKYYGLSDKQLKAITSSLMLNSHINYLILQDNRISPESAMWLSEMLRENNSIKVLNLKECRLGPEGIKNCVDGFSLNQSLREIDLSYNDLGDVGVETLVEALKDNPNIEKLNLGHNNLGEISGKLIGGWLKEPNNLDFLDLSWNDLYAGKALKLLFDGMNSQTLKYLNLSWNGIGHPDAVGPIVKYLKSNDVIEHLDLSFNR